jgi:hypothetical protein
LKCLTVFVLEHAGVPIVESPAMHGVKLLPFFRVVVLHRMDYILHIGGDIELWMGSRQQNQVKL